MANKRAVTLTITSDVVCPWCYIATLELRKAISRAYTNQLPLLFRLEYKPFEFNAVVSGMSEQARKGFSERLIGIYHTISARGQDFGVTFARGPSGKVWKSTMANRLLMYAYQHGGQDAQQALLTELYRAHHEKKEDIEDFETLSKYAEKTGLMSRQETCMFLQSDDLRAEVEEMVDQGRSMGISSVPLTVVNNKWSIVGAQSSEVYYQIFVKLSQGKEL
ncbi:thioredoxin-like protein [Ceratobasidium sp. AG-I]|nr:thioredoxin-like protein [Ceratobasidium sp. AG-I]